MMKFEALYFSMEGVVKESEENGNNPQSQLIKIRDQINEDPQRSRASLLLADIYFQHGELEKAKSIYQEIINTTYGLISLEMNPILRLSLPIVSPLNKFLSKLVDRW